MKTIIFTLFLSTIFIQTNWAQPTLIKKTKRVWDGNLAEWRVIDERTWDYENGDLKQSMARSFSFIVDDWKERNYSLQEYENGLVKRRERSFLSFNEYHFSEEELWYEGEELVEKWSTGYSIRYEGILDFDTPIDTTYFTYGKRYAKEYDANGNLLSSASFDIWEDGTVIPVTAKQHEYNDNGCLIKTRTGSEMANFNDKTEFQVDADCFVTQRIDYQKPDANSDFQMVNKSKHVKTELEDGYIVVDSIFYPRFDMWTGIFTHFFYDGTEERQYNEKNQMVRETFVNTLSPVSETLLEYDEKDRQIVLEHYLWQENEGFVLNHFDKRAYTEVLDENGFLISFIYDSNIFLEGEESMSSSVTHYDNFCDGTVAESQYYPHGAVSAIRTSFEYLEGIDCEFEKERPALAVYPNPSEGVFQLNGEILSGASTQIKVLNALGQLVWQINVPEQTWQREVNLSHLNNGNYVIFIENGDYFSTEKITIFK